MNPIANLERFVNRRVRSPQVICIVTMALLLQGRLPAAGLSRDSILAQSGFVQKLDKALPLGLEFKDESGKTVRLGRFFGSQPALLVFAYFECPMLCTAVLNGLVHSLEALSLRAGRDFRVVVVSIDPEETFEVAAAKKNKYLQRYRGGDTSGEGWHFLTGQEPSISRLAEAAGFGYTYIPEKDEFAHAGGLLVVTPEGRVSRYFFGVEFPPRNLRLALVEAADRKIGSLTDRLVLFCFRYDPDKGKYTMLVSRVLQAASLFNFMVLGGGIFVWLRRDRIRKMRGSMQQSEKAGEHGN